MGKKKPEWCIGSGYEAARACFDLSCCHALRIVIMASVSIGTVRVYCGAVKRGCWRLAGMSPILDDCIILCHECNSRTHHESRHRSYQGVALRSTPVKVVPRDDKRISATASSACNMHATLFKCARLFKIGLYPGITAVAQQAGCVSSETATIVCVRH